jgi:hypothetical protein
MKSIMQWFKQLFHKPFVSPELAEHKDIIDNKGWIE